MVEVSIPIAFVAGLVSFFAPCVVPLIPAYVSYVTGVSAQDIKKGGLKSLRKKAITSSLFYVLGFSLIFVLLGSISATIGVFLRKNSFAIQKIGGAVMMVLGLHFAGTFKISFLNYQRNFKIPTWLEKFKHLRSFFLGVVFATAWSPCISAVLGSILALSASTQTALGGAVLLFFYSLGISFPFLLISLTLTSTPKYLKWITKHIGIISKVSGFVLAMIGLSLVTDTYKYINYWIFAILN